MTNKKQNYHIVISPDQILHDELVLRERRRFCKTTPTKDMQKTIEAKRTKDWQNSIYVNVCINILNVKVEKDCVSSYMNGVDMYGGKDDSQEPVGLPRCTRVVFWRRIPPPPLPTA
uniref:Uncharacterized protein n=1 Tax=Glossina pallidipes TaxID=7398 RepID=A0A1B0AAA2_GLOPL